LEGFSRESPSAGVSPHEAQKNKKKKKHKNCQVETGDIAVREAAGSAQIGDETRNEPMPSKERGI